MPQADTVTAETRWHIGVDWLLNNVDQSDFAAPFWAYYDGVITLEELRAESVGVEEINSRRTALDGDA